MSFERDPTTGELTEGIVADACLSEHGSENCATARGISGPNGVTVAPLGDFVYVASSGSSAVASLLRSSASGALDQLPGPDGCTGEGGHEGCSTGRGLAGAFALGISPHGDNLYAAALNGIAIFGRDPSSGRLVELSGSRGCFETSAREGCARGRGLSGASSIAVSPDGRSVYVAALESGSVAVFARTTDATALRVKLFGVPTRCVSRPFTVRASATSTLPLRTLRLMVDQRLLARTTRHQLRLRVAVHRLRSGLHRMLVNATDAAGDKATRSVRFKRCG